MSLSRAPAFRQISAYLATQSDNVPENDSPSTRSDDLMMIALDAGAEDFAEEEDSFEILTQPEDFADVRDALEAEGIPMADAQVTMIPQTYVELTDEQDLYNINKILNLLDEDDDVQEVYHNWDE